MTRGSLGALWVLCAWLVGSHAARAETAVELRETKGLRPELCTALRIQLADVGEVRCASEPEPGPLPERIAQAAGAVRAGETRMAVLLERDVDPNLVRMYVVGGQADRAVLAFERIEDRPEPDVDRSLALKVRAALEAVRVVREAQAPEAEGELAAALVPAPRSETYATQQAGQPGEPARRSYAGALEVGGGASFGQHTRGLGHGALVIGLYRRGVRLEGGALARWFAPLSVRGPRGSVDENEWTLGLSLRALRSLGARFELGVALDPVWSVVSARGTTRSGARGEERLGRFTFTVAVDLRLRLFASTFLRFAPGVDLAPVRQRFAVDGDVTLELKRAQLLLPLSVWVGWP